MFAGLVRDLILRNGITTSIAKAKAVQPLVEKLITKAKHGDETSRRRVDAVLTDRKLTQQLFDWSKTRFADRTSGFTRIIKLGKRKGDSTDLALLSFVDEKVVVDTIAPKRIKEPAAVKKKEKKSAKVVKKTKATKKSVKKVAKKA